MKYQEQLIPLLQIAGVGQIFIALIYNWVRKILEWDADIDRMENRWNQQIAHTYSRYIQGLNFAFGLIALFFASEFFRQNAVASALSLLTAVYWLGRFLIALGYYDTSHITETRKLFRYGAWGFNGLFAYLFIVYATVFLVNFF